jgi:hypothetical protein
MCQFHFPYISPDHFLSFFSYARPHFSHRSWPIFPNITKCLFRHFFISQRERGDADEHTPSSSIGHHPSFLVVYKIYITECFYRRSGRSEERPPSSGVAAACAASTAGSEQASHARAWWRVAGCSRTKRSRRGVLQSES